MYIYIYKFVKPSSSYNISLLRAYVTKIYTSTRKTHKWSYTLSHQIFNITGEGQRINARLQPRFVALIYYL